jgi:hypothetical protein
VKVAGYAGEGDLWDFDALALPVELPPVVEALQLAVDELAFRQLG